MATNRTVLEFLADAHVQVPGAAAHGSLATGLVLGPAASASPEIPVIVNRFGSTLAGGPLRKHSGPDDA